MVSRKNYFTIVSMMLVLLFMFQFLQLIREKGSRYDVNKYVYEELPDGADQWRMTENLKEVESGEFVVFFGREGSKTEAIVKQWCNYTKRDYIRLLKMEDYSGLKGKKPEAILFDGESVKWNHADTMLSGIMKEKVPVIFCSLPDVAVIKESELLQEVLGIRYILYEETKLQGIQLFSGFLLGGERLYRAMTEEEELRQDMELETSWFLLSAGTKTYLSGISFDEKVKDEEQPALIWRNCYEDTMVFAVNGSYMSALAGIGILDAFMYEAKPHQIYPVINAQNILVCNFPLFADENEELLKEIYNRSPQTFMQEIMWPGLSAMAEQKNLKLTCFFNPQYDYEDDQEPETENVVFYLQQLCEIEAEAGKSIFYKGTTELKEVLARDEAFYSFLPDSYRYQAVFADAGDVGQIQTGVQQNAVLTDMKTLAAEYSEGTPLVSYLTDGVTLQRTTGNAKSYTYMEDMTVLGLQTALGYSNVLLDLEAAYKPKEITDQWQYMFEEMASNVSTYWSGSGFEQTTLSESDLRVRGFLNLDYRDYRDGDTLTLEIKKDTEYVWFLLRTHDEKIKEVRGGAYQMLEKNAYLIKVSEEVVEIELEPLVLKELKER